MVIPLSRKRYIMKTLFYYIQTMLECCINSNIEREKNNYFARAKGGGRFIQLIKSRPKARGCTRMGQNIVKNSSLISMIKRGT